jgi:hypothetical protein
MTLISKDAKLPIREQRRERGLDSGVPKLTVVLVPPEDFVLGEAELRAGLRANDRDAGIRILL